MADKPNLTDALASNYMLVDLSVRLWSGRVTDRAVSHEVTASKGAIDGAAKVIKYLLAGADAEFKEVKSAYTAIRTWFYNNSLPWTENGYGQQKGARLISVVDAGRFLGEFAGLKSEAETARDKLKAVWDQRLAESQRTTGQLFDPMMFPSKAELDHLFDAHMSINVIPAAASYHNVSIPADLATGLEELYERQAESRIENAMNDLQERMTSELTRTVAQLTKVANGEKTRLYKSLTGNLKQLVNMARNLNLANSPALDDLADEIESKLLVAEVDDFKGNAALARSVAGHASEILERASDRSLFTSQAHVMSQPEVDNDDDGADEPAGGIRDTATGGECSGSGADTGATAHGDAQHGAGRNGGAGPAADGPRSRPDTAPAVSEDSFDLDEMLL